MPGKIQKWGNSQGIRLSRAMLADARLAVGDEVDIVVEKHLITISPAKKIRGKHNLESLVACIPKGSKAKELDWSEPVGKEAW